MSAPYDLKRMTPSVYGERRPVEGVVVALLHIAFDDRDLKLIQTKSRTLRHEDIHELMITDEEEAAPGGGANRVRALAFFEVEKSGLIVVGDKVTVEDNDLGTLAGYDETHMPNHMNILVKTCCIDEFGLRVGDRVRFGK